MSIDVCFTSGGLDVEIFLINVCLFDSLRRRQQFFSYVGTGLPRLNQYYAGINVLLKDTTLCGQ